MQLAAARLVSYFRFKFIGVFGRSDKRCISNCRINWRCGHRLITAGDLANIWEKVRCKNCYILYWTKPSGRLTMFLWWAFGLCWTLLTRFSALWSSAPWGLAPLATAFKRLEHSLSLAKESSRMLLNGVNGNPSIGEAMKVIRSQVSCKAVWEAARNMRADMSLPQVHIRGTFWKSFVWTFKFWVSFHVWPSCD